MDVGERFEQLEIEIQDRGAAVLDHTRMKLEKAANARVATLNVPHSMRVLIRRRGPGPRNGQSRIEALG